MFTIFFIITVIVLIIAIKLDNPELMFFSALAFAIFLFLTAALWGMSIIFTNIAYSENIKTFQMMFFRFFPSAIIIFIVFGKSMFPINKTAVINGKKKAGATNKRVRGVDSFLYKVSVF